VVTQAFDHGGRESGLARPGCPNELDDHVHHISGSACVSQDRKAVVEATDALHGAAGNFYINDKPTGAVVGQQPFGGARGSGTNDKAGSKLNLVRWVSARAVKETFNPPRDYKYPFMADE
jgi:1-pyrroline-5-carboxylate dehydrogenase